MAHVGREKRLAAKIAGIMVRTATAVATKASSPSAKRKAAAPKTTRTAAPRPAAKKTS